MRTLSRLALILGVACPCALVLAGEAVWAAQTVPLPPERPLFDAPPPSGPLPRPGWQSTPRVPDAMAPTSEPSVAVGKPAAPEEPSACQIRLAAGIAAFKPLPPITGPGSCGGTDIVSLEAVVLADKTRVTLTPPATLRCPMAEAVAHWVRDDMAPAAADLGSPLRAIENFDSFDCRGRNRIVGAKMSEHGKANALDIRAVKLANNRVVQMVEFVSPLAFRTAMRASACARFMTVLGPGSDGYHENHAHVDLAERRGNYKFCHWDLEKKPPPQALKETDQEAAQAGADTEMAEAIPLPRPRPAFAVERRSFGRRERL